MADAPADVVVFELRGLRCAMPVRQVGEVFSPGPVTLVPGTPASVRGLVLHHGRVLPLLDVSVFWGGVAGPVRPLEQALAVEAPLGAEGPMVAAAFAVDRIVRLSPLARAPAPRPTMPVFVNGCVADPDGPAWLIDASEALRAVRQAATAAWGGA